MAVDNFAFNPADGLLNAASYPTKPVSENAARQQVQDPLNQMRDFLNNTLIPSLYIGAGLAGATTAVRFAGGTTTGAPTTGTFVKGDFVIDQSGLIWICTAAGTPGTWSKSTPRFQSRIPIFRGNYSNSLTTNAVPPNSLLRFQFKASEWSSNSFYCEVYANASSATLFTGVYDITANSAVTASEITMASGTSGQVRSGSFTLTDGHEYSVYVRNSSASSTSLIGFDILSLI